MKNKRSRKGLCVIFTGLLLVAAALFLIFHNLYEDYRAAQSTGQAAKELERSISGKSTGESCGDSETAIPDYLLNPDMEMPVKNIDGQDYIGMLDIPSCNLELPVISDLSYSKLKIAPCRYAGSAYTNNLVIAAHNYQAHFGHLKNLEAGEQVIFTDMDGNVFQYVVVMREILMPADTLEMESGEWDLTLFTCSVGGQSRITVRCMQEKQEDK